jgi:hypothetical protein
MPVFSKIFSPAAAILLVIWLAACGAGNDESLAGDETTLVTENSTDRAAIVAAQTMLQKAQTAQEAFFSRNQRYASTIEDLKKEDSGVSPRVTISSGDAAGYEMRIEASDSARTTLVIRKSGSRVERTKSSGGGW